MWTVPAGALLFICGLLLLVWRALEQRRFSEPNKLGQDRPTLEPRRQGVRFLGMRNLPGLVLMAVGGFLLLSGAF